MSETGNIGESANDLSYQAREETNEGGNQNETYETKLKDGPGSSCVGHKKLLSEQFFDDLLSITPQGVTNHSHLVENLGAVAAATSEAASQRQFTIIIAFQPISPALFWLIIVKYPSVPSSVHLWAASEVSVTAVTAESTPTTAPR
eukprot:scaffold90498_cov23-Cyclotella_meneghiniana.AAC.1